jgi:hypothetical protein
VILDVRSKTYGPGLEKPVLTIGCSRNQFSDNTAVNFQAPPDCSILAMSFQDLSKFVLEDIR